MNAWLTQHRNAFALALRRLAGMPLNTLLAALAIGIALALPAGGQMLLGTLQELSQNSSTTPQISVFMTLDAGKPAAETIEKRLRAHAGVKSVLSLPREQTLERMKANEGLREVIEALPKNPFPDAFVAIPQDESPEAMERLRDEFKSWPRVGHVQLDAAWVKRLAALLRLARIGMWLLAGLFGAGLIAITFNAIRLQILAHRAEIEVIRLLGADDSFIRRPFYYFGALQGLFGGIIAWLIITGAIVFLREPVAELAGLYETGFALSLPDPGFSAALLALASGLGLIGAALSVGRYVREA